MNIIAIDIGNTNINVGLFLNGEEKFIETVAGQDENKLTEVIKSAWQQAAGERESKNEKISGVIVASSVKPAWTRVVRGIAEKISGTKMLVVGEDVPLPLSVWVDEPAKIGTDRVVAAAAAYAVVGDAVVVADFGTAVTIDLVDEHGVFQGGVILPGFDISAKALSENTSQLPKVKVARPEKAFGKNTHDAINCGLYYSAVGTLQEIIRRYAETIGKWPQTILTGSAARLIQADCDFIDSYVPSLTIKGIVLAYQKYIEQENDSAEL